MKRLGRLILRVITLALALSLAAALFPYVRDLARSILPQGKYQQTVTLISHEMEKAGELTAVRHIDWEVLESSTKALLIGEVQQVKVPYQYEIGLGIRLDEVAVNAKEDSIQVTVPEAEMLYDSFRVTGEAEVSSFFYPLKEKQYQEMLDAQAAACREKYLKDPDMMDSAWQEACAALRALISQWTGEELPLTFVRAAAPLS